MNRVLLPARLLALVALLLIHSPGRAEVHGGIELGAKGVKATAIDITGEGDEQEVKVLLSVSHNSTLSMGIAKTGVFDPKAVKDAAAAVTRFAERMKTEFKVPAERIHVVGSSGLFSAIEDKKDSIAANQETLAKAVQEASGIKMSFISDEREAELSIAGIVPRSKLGVAVLLDIGSGNTKGGYRDGDKGYVTFSVPYASVTFTEVIRKRAGKGDWMAFAEAAALARQEVLSPALKKSLEGKPEMLKKEPVYLSGGAFWALATLTRPGDRHSFVALTAEDIERYHRLLIEAKGEYPTIDFSSIKNTAIREAAEKEVTRIKAAFKPEQLLSGAEIIKGLSKEFGFDSGKKLYFVRHAQIGWILAFVKEKAVKP
jgi:exopolyphosphatase/pppGpp-phosphohydrolase